MKRFILLILLIPMSGFSVAYPSTIDQGVCCKVCHKGKACGNSCISRYNTCHKAAGCACDGE